MRDRSIARTLHTSYVPDPPNGQALVEEADAARRKQPAITFDVTYRVPHPEGGILRTFDRNLQQRFEQVRA